MSAIMHHHTTVTQQARMVVEITVNFSYFLQNVKQDMQHFENGIRFNIGAGMLRLWPLLRNTSINPRTHASNIIN